MMKDIDAKVILKKQPNVFRGKHVNLKMPQEKIIYSKIGFEGICNVMGKMGLIVT